MKKGSVVLLSCVMAFTMVITVSANSSKSISGAKKEFSIDMASHPAVAKSAAQTGGSSMKKVENNAVQAKGGSGGILGSAGYEAPGEETASSEAKGNPESGGKSSRVEPQKPAETTPPGTAQTETTQPGTTQTETTQTETTQTETTQTETTQTETVQTGTTQSGTEDNASGTDKGSAEPEKSVQVEVVSHKFELLSPEVYGDILLVNKANPLDGKFIPEGLVQISAKAAGAPVSAKRSGLYLKSNALTAFGNMYKAAVEAGVGDMVISSAYRSFNEQNSLYVKKVNSLIRSLGRKAAEDKAATVVAVPGRSEHQTGLAVDVTTRQLLGRSDPLVEEFASTACGKWLSAHSWEYGFVLRYKPDKVHVTGIISEPWHFRYVGRLHAEVMYKNRFCLEEYVKYLKTQSRLSFPNYMGSSYELAYVCPPAGTEILNVSADKGAEVTVSRLDASGYLVAVRKPLTEVGK